MLFSSKFNNSFDGLYPVSTNSPISFTALNGQSYKVGGFPIF